MKITRAFTFLDWVTLAAPRFGVSPRAFLEMNVKDVIEAAERKRRS